MRDLCFDRYLALQYSAHIEDTVHCLPHTSQPVGSTASTAPKKTVTADAASLPIVMQSPPHPPLRFGDLGLSLVANRLEAIGESHHIIKFYNARGAMFHLFSQLKSAGRCRVLMPAYHCVSMIDPALHAGLEVSYYRVDRNLGIDVEDALAHAGEDVCAFVFVNFFGFPADIDKIAPELRRRGIAIIEDSSHSFLAWQPYGLAGGRGDYTVYSFAKLVPCGVGGGLRAHGQPFEAPALLRSAPKDSVVRSKRLLEQAILSADERSSLRRAYVALEVARVERKRAKSAGQGTGGTRAVEPAQGGACSFGNLAFEPFHARTRIPWLPHRILKGADLRDIAARRRRNYSLYAEQLAHLVAPPSVLPELGDSVCPWAYPILVADRAQHDVRLRSLGVPVWTFGDLLHPNVEAFASPAAATDARFLSTHLLCLPVHQGLQPDTIAGFARIVADANLPRVST